MIIKIANFAKPYTLLISIVKSPVISVKKAISAAKFWAKKSFLWWSSVQTNQLSVGTQRTRNFTFAFQRDDIFTHIWTTSHLYLL